MVSPALLSLTDDQITTIMAACRPLALADRETFLELLAQELSGRGEIGDGGLYRVIRDLQKRFFQPPEFGTPGKYA